MGRTEAADGAESGGLGVGETVRELREAYEGGRTRSLAWRQAQLRGLLRLLEEKEVEAFQALHKDLGKHHAEAYRDEVGVLIKSANGALQQLGKWMAPEKASHGKIMAFLLRQPLLSDASVSANACRCGSR